MNHLGIREFSFIGYCIGGPFALKLMERASDCVVAGVLCQPVGRRSQNPDVMYNSGRDVWTPELLARRPEVTMATITAYLHNLYRVQPDFVYSVSRDFARSCQTAMLVMPDDTPARPYQTAVDIASLAPKAEITLYPWREPPELLARTINRVRTFRRAHQPVKTEYPYNGAVETGAAPPCHETRGNALAERDGDVASGVAAPGPDFPHARYVAAGDRTSPSGAKDAR